MAIWNQQLLLPHAICCISSPNASITATPGAFVFESRNYRHAFVFESRNYRHAFVEHDAPLLPRKARRTRVRRACLGKTGAPCQNAARPCCRGRRARVGVAAVASCASSGRCCSPACSSSFSFSCFSCFPRVVPRSLCLLLAFLLVAAVFFCFFLLLLFFLFFLLTKKQPQKK